MIELEPRLSREKAELVALCCLPSLTYKMLLDLLCAFGTPAGAWAAIESGDAPSAMDTPAPWEDFARGTEPRSVIESMKESGIEVVVLTEEGYPSRLADIDRPPFAIFYKGRLPDEAPAVAVVGSRKATPYGIEASRSLGCGLALAGVTVVSGAAHGIDSFAHIGALDAGGRTVAVLGCGPDIAYPPSSAKLLARIARTGCVMSEYPPGFQPTRYTFPDRNRIIAGLSLGVVVVEASQKSGALITSDYGAAYSREVMAVPGPVFCSNSTGSNGLIRSGAALIRNHNDVLDELGLARTISPQVSLLGEDESRQGLLAALAAGTRDVDELSRTAELSSAETLVALCSLEMEGLARRGPGGCFEVTAAGYQAARR